MLEKLIAPLSDGQDSDRPADRMASLLDTDDIIVLTIIQTHLHLYSLLSPPESAASTCSRSLNIVSIKLRT